ncbi:MAG TPA: hypothetical protein PLH64_05515 [Anaerolineaceae bacterium]|nr:hypothetical protein [Anaerolineaceae bacterium]
MNIVMDKRVVPSIRRNGDLTGKVRLLRMIDGGCVRHCEPRSSRKSKPTCPEGAWQSAFKLDDMVEKQIATQKKLAMTRKIDGVMANWRHIKVTAE